MRSLGKILGSAARTDILRALHYQPEPVGLRHLATLAAVQPRSAQLALAALEREALVTRRKTATRALYALNRAHSDVPVLKAIFDAAARTVRASRRRDLDRKAKTLLPFMAEASGMINHARRDGHVT
jgi:DNA-binding transcriptional ArsR family regulator